jgi:predicted transposase/invertase (TIGR01784 family)
VSTVESDKVGDLEKVITKSLKNGATVMRTIAEMWLQEGIEKGIEKGREQGIEQAYIEMVDKMAQNGMSNADIRKITGLSLAKIGQIRKRGKRK